MKKNGFTLVELAIVMTIIGLLIGGILKAQSMVENAKITRTINTVESFKVAIISFRDKYGGIPGDMVNATTRLPNCNASFFCSNGNGNDKLGQSEDVDNIAWSTFLANKDVLPNLETVMVWKHLVLSNYLSGVNPSSNPANPGWGETHPASTFAGGFELFYDPYTTAGATGNFLRLSNDGLTRTVSGTNGTAAVSPMLASKIDRKMDDGLPLSGFMMANYGVRTDGCNLDSEYRETDSRNNCILFWVY